MNVENLRKFVDFAWDLIVDSPCGSDLLSKDWDGDEEGDLAVIDKAFEELEEVEKAELVGHAHWLYDPNANDWGIGGWCCSHCHYKNDSIGISEHPNIPISAIAGTRYCGNCGSRMDEVIEDENH